jgi:hypothetical protein
MSPQGGSVEPNAQLKSCSMLIVGNANENTKLKKKGDVLK